MSATMSMDPFGEEDMGEMVKIVIDDVEKEEVDKLEEPVNNENCDYGKGSEQISENKSDIDNKEQDKRLIIDQSSQLHLHSPQQFSNAHVTTADSKPRNTSRSLPHTPTKATDGRIPPLPSTEELYRTLGLILPSHLRE